MSISSFLPILKILLYGFLVQGNDYIGPNNNGKSREIAYRKLLNDCSNGSFVLDVIVKVDYDPSSISWNLNKFYSNEIMFSENGANTSSYSVHQKQYCLENETYKFNFHVTKGYYDSYYKLLVNNHTIEEIERPLDFYSHQTILCSNDADCSDDNVCTRDVCNKEMKMCTHVPTFSHVCRSHGTSTSLVIRTIAEDAETSSSSFDLQQAIFGTVKDDELSMRSQFLACSFDKFNIMPFSGISINGIEVINGIIDLNIPQNVIGEQAGIVADRVISLAYEQLGDLNTQFDFLLVCLPPGTLIADSSSWKAYAFVGASISIYNNENCLYTSVLMHELGHNIGLSHSNDEANYGDEVGYMGISYSLRDGPRKCFNAAKSWDLMWYYDYHQVIDIEQLEYDKWPGYSFNVIGIPNHNIRNNVFLSSEFHVILKLENIGDNYDYFIMFNEKSKMNMETNEGGDKVIIVKREVGAFYRDSFVHAILGENQKASIYNSFTGAEVVIAAEFYIYYAPVHVRIHIEKFSAQKCNNDDSCKTLSTCIIDKCDGVDSFGYNVCTHTPMQCSLCGAEVKVIAISDSSSDDLVWSIKNYKSSLAVMSSGYSSNRLEKSASTETKCLNHGTYIFSIIYTGNNNISSWNSSDFFLYVGETLMDNGTIYQGTNIESIFIICSTHEDCYDYDGCSIDQCNNRTKICNNTILESQDCNNCTWINLNITMDNFPEETSWFLYEVETNDVILSGDPYPFDIISAFGRSKAPTRAGRRKSPTKSGRSKAPTRAAITKQLVADNLYTQNRLLEEEENVFVHEELCLENTLKYLFVILDSFGDGICCAEGDGEYILSIGNHVVQNGGDFINKEEFLFRLVKCSSDSDCDYGEGSCVTSACLLPGILCSYKQKVCSECGSMVHVNITTDFFPLETTWNIQKQEQINKVILQGGPYSLSSVTYETSQCLPFGSYKFSLFDITGNGLSICYDPTKTCGYSLSLDETIIKKGKGMFKFELTKSFDISLCNNHTIAIELVGYEDQDLKELSWNVSRVSTDELIVGGSGYIETNTFDRTSACIEAGIYKLKYISTGDSWFKFLIYVGNELVQSVKSYASKAVSGEEEIVICTVDSDCDTGDSCIIGTCNILKHICLYESLPCSMCLTSYESCQSNNSSCLIDCSDCGQTEVRVDIQTDGTPRRISWFIIKDMTTEYTMESAHFYDEYYTYQSTQCVDSGTYNFVLKDNVGDTVGETAYYKVYISGNIVLEGDFYFGYTKNEKLIICENDSDCDTDDTCSLNTCELDGKYCKKEQLPCENCLIDYKACYQEDNTKCIPTDCSECEKGKISVEVFTDTNPYQLSWAVYNSSFSDTEILSSDVFIEPFRLYRRSYCLDEGIYSFIMRDSFGNGFTDGRGYDYGTYYKFFVENELLKEGTGEFYEETTSFSIRLPSDAPSMTPSFSLVPSIQKDYISNWFISYKGIEVNSAFEQVSLEFEISKRTSNGYFHANIYDKTCKEKYTEHTVLILKEIVNENKTGDVETVNVSIAINKNSTKSSKLWQNTSYSSGALIFCVIAELFQGNLSVSFIETIVSLSIDLDSSFTSGIKMELSKQDAEIVNKESIINLQACVCDGEGDDAINCLHDTRINQNSQLNLCIFPENNVFITEVESLVLFQDGVAKAFPIQRGQSDPLSTVFLRPSYAFISTRLLSVFFTDPDPSPVTITGEALIDFNIRRVLVQSSSSKLEGRTYAQFQLTMEINGSGVFSRKLKLFVQLSFLGATFILFLLLRIRKKSNLYKRINEL